MAFGHRTLSLLLAAALGLAFSLTAMASGDPAEPALIEDGAAPDASEPTADAPELLIPEDMPQEPAGDSTGESAGSAEDPGEYESHDKESDSDGYLAEDPWLAAQILLAAVGLPAEETDGDSADINGDGKVNAADAAALLPETGAPADPIETPAPDEPDEPEGPEEPEAPDDPGFFWNGRTEIWGIIPDADGAAVITCLRAADIMKSDGWTYTEKDTGGDTAEALRLVEEAVSSGAVGALLISVPNAEALEDAVTRAEKAGIAVAFIGAEPDYPVAGYIYSAYELVGMYAALAAEDWAKNIDNGYPLETAVFTRFTTLGDSRCTRAILGAVNGSDLLSLVSEVCLCSDPYEDTLAVLAEHPDCRVFIAGVSEDASRITEAIGDYCEENGLNLADFCVSVCCALRDDALDLYYAAEEDPSAAAVKACAVYGDPVERRGCILYSPMELMGIRMAGLILSACGDTGWSSFTYGEAYYDRVYATNIFGFSLTWQNGDENPAAGYKS